MTTRRQQGAFAVPWEKQFDKDAVLDRAMRTFWARGYEATSIQDLVKRTGVNRASLYATYGDKHALFLASLRMYDDLRRRQMLADLEATFAPVEAIRRMFVAFTEGVDKATPTDGCFLTNTALELSAKDRDVRAIVGKAQQEVEAFFERMVRQGQSRGDIAASLDARDTARGLLASMLGMLVLVRSRPDRSLMDAVIRDVLRRLV